MFGKLGPQELLIIIGIGILIFGPTRIPQVGRGLGKAFKEYKGFKKDLKEDLESPIKDAKDSVESVEDKDDKG